MLVLCATGILEVFYYIPTPDQAAQSLQTLVVLVPFGGLVRNLHFWAAQLLILVCMVHLLRVIIPMEGVPVNFIDLDNLKKNKKASGRHQDLADLEALE